MTEGRTTESLIGSLRYWRAFESQNYWREPEQVFSYNACGDPYGCGCGSTSLSTIRRAIARLKKVLATREHVPNKEERKELRRQRAKEGRTRDKVRRR